jgi:hypothetical protein
MRGPLDQGCRKDASRHGRSLGNSTWEVPPEIDYTLAEAVTVPNPICCEFNDLEKVASLSRCPYWVDWRRHLLDMTQLSNAEYSG